MNPPEDCTCNKCVGACKHQPGWFKPGEAEKAAELLGMEFAEFKDKYLITEYWCGDEETEDTDVLAPRKVGVDVGKDRASWGAFLVHAPCVFLKDERCQIHAAKPYECKMSMCCDPQQKNLRSDIAEAWGRVR